MPMRARDLLACLCLVVANLAWSAPSKLDLSSPIQDCTTLPWSQSPCVSRVYVRPQPAAKLDAFTKEGEAPKLPDQCLPHRYLELWDNQARQESEQRCELPEGSLKPLAQYFGCSDGTDPASCNRMAWGVALEGGGSKSAPFAMGVLAGLQSTGILQKANIITSASGGTYAAYFYFARLLDRATAPPGEHESDDPITWFKDCIPSVYRTYFPSLSDAPVEFCQEHKAPFAYTNPFLEHAPYQRQVRMGQDLLVPGQTLRQRGDSRLSSDWLAAYLNVGWLAVEHVFSAPPHWLAHGLFDWPSNFAPSAEVYRKGIERAYGHTNRSWASVQPEWAQPASISQPPFTGNLYERSWTLDDLRGAYQDSQALCRTKGQGCDFPLWVMSTTSTAGRSLSSWISLPPKDAQRFAFELGPMGHGSGLLGFVNVPPPNMTIRDAVGTSAAFLDDEQRTLFDKQPARALLNSALFVANADWGSEVPNFNTSDAKRRLYKLMPMPVYGFPVFQGLDAPYVHLTDGGNSDNLGLLPQLRRGVRNIVISASTDDEKGSFPSLCKVKNELELEHASGEPSEYTLLMPDLAHFDEVCNQHLRKQEIATWGVERVKALYCKRIDPAMPQEACDTTFAAHKPRHTGYDLWHWPAPVQEGCVIRRSKQLLAPEACPEAREDGREISRLHVIKPAIWLPSYDAQFSQTPAKPIIRYCVDMNRPVAQRAIGTLPEAGAWPTGMDLPCQTLAFIHGTWALDLPRSAHPDFPQDNFVSQTLNSSYTLYGAYYDLGRHYAAQIKESAPDKKPQLLPRLTDTRH